MATIPSAGYISNAARTQGEVKQALEDTIASLRQVPGSGQVELTATISSGSFTPAGSGGVIVVDTEAASATDDLTNVATTNYPDGSCILLRNANSARFVVLKNAAGGGGQLNLDRSSSYTLDDTKKWVLLQRRSADWYEIMRGPARMVSPAVAKSATFTVGLEDIGKTFLCTGTFTANLPAVANAGNGFFVIIKNVSTGAITIDGNSSETIDGFTTIVVPALWSYTIVTDGSSWQTVSSTGPQPSINPIINGNLEIWQRGSSFVGITNGQYCADRFMFGIAGSGVANANRSTNVPSLASAGVLFNYSLEVDVTTADASMASTDLGYIRTSIEGHNWRHFAQRQFTISFWVLSSKTGTHCIAFRNTGADRSYVAEYTINAADTWEYKTITVTASPSAGTWDYLTLVGLNIYWMYASGSSFNTTPGAWQTGAFLSTSNQVNVLDSTSNFFRLTGIKIDLGSVATPIQFVPFEMDLARCRRYYQKSFLYTTTPAQNTGSGDAEQSIAGKAGTTTQLIEVRLHPELRAAPTVTLYNPSAANGQIRDLTAGVDCSATAVSNGNAKALTLTATGNASTAVGNILSIHWIADAEL